MNNLEVKDMNNRVIRLLTMGFFMTMTWHGAIAQIFTITRVELEGDQFNIYYDLIDNDPTHTYTVRLFSSRDNFVTHLKKVTGDAGPYVSPRTNKKIVWNIAEEFGDHEYRKINFQVKGVLDEPYLKLKQNYTKIKRGKSYELTWTGGANKEPLQIELLYANKKVEEFLSVTNEQMYNLKLPTSLKPGKLYKLKIYSRNDPLKTTFTNEFQVRRRVPVILKVLPFVIVGSVVYFLTAIPETNRLPDPIKP